MKKSLILLSLFISANINAQEKIIIKYPTTTKGDQKDVYFGRTVEDPYRWLEDENSNATRSWVTSQNEATFSYLSRIPYRNKIKTRLTEIWNYERYSAPFKKGKYYFYYKNDGVQNQSVLYVQDSLNSEGRVLIDPNKLSTDGTVAMTDFSVSKNGKYAVYGTSKAGSDWKNFYVIEIPSGKRTQDSIMWVKFSGVAWKDDGFYYSRFKKPEEAKALSNKNEFSKIYYHKLGTSQEADQIIHKDDEHPLRSFYAATTEDEKYLIISETESTSGNALYFKDLTKSAAPIVKIADGFTYDYNVVDNLENALLVHTNDNAPRYRLIKIDLNKPDKSNWADVIPQKEEVLENVSLSDGKLVVKYMKDVTSRLSIYSTTGKYEKDITLPGVGVVQGFSSDKDEPLAFYTLATFTAPPVIYKYDIRTNNSEVYKKPKINFNAGDYETKQVFYNSKDGTKVPMFITHKKGVQLNGNNPTLLYGYGGFNISITPGFSPSTAVFLEQGGIYAVANIRGGGEYGQDWHRSGTKLQKQNVFNDFISAAEYLIANKYTNPEKLAVTGRSNGGLLVGAVMTQRPDLFKVAVPEVGVLDMLRYHKFTIGYAWATDYGTSEEEDQFNNLITYSPVHNVRPVSYPATLVTTGDHDDRVVPAHSYKFISALQEKHKGPNPVLIRIDVDAGHGAGKPVSKQIDESADKWAFIMYNLGMDVK